MFNARVVYIKGLEQAKREIRKVGVDSGGIPWLSPKALHRTLKIENVTSFAANIIKQEMLASGGDAAVNRGVVNCSVDRSDVLVMGTLNQLERLVYKLGMQSGSLKEIAKEVQAIVEGIKEGKTEVFRCGKYALPIGEKTYVMGILNITPDSFSDGGKYLDIGSAVKKARDMVVQGADIIDIGGESTRPGYTPVEDDEETQRVVPVIEALAKELDIPLSIDTSKAAVAEQALKAGAVIVNDVWGLQKDPNLADVVVEREAGVVMMHNQQDKTYTDLMGDIIRGLRRSVEIAECAGIQSEYMAIDPGIGFAKTYEHNLEVMKRLRELSVLKLPVLLGTSRKSIIGNTLGLAVNERVEGTAATVALGIAYGTDFIRVHDVKEMARVAKMTDAMVRKS